MHACSRVVVSGGKMATLGDASAPGVNGLIQQFTAITGKYSRFAFVGDFYPDCFALEKTGCR